MKYDKDLLMQKLVAHEGLRLDVYKRQQYALHSDFGHAYFFPKNLVAERTPNEAATITPREY